MSALHRAAVNNYGDLLSLLLGETERRVNITNKEMETPLMMASYAGRDLVARRLCAVAAVGLNCADLNGWTALHWAVDQSRQRSALCSYWSSSYITGPRHCGRHLEEIA